MEKKLNDMYSRELNLDEMDKISGGAGEPPKQDEGTNDSGSISDYIPDKWDTR